MKVQKYLSSSNNFWAHVKSALNGLNIIIKNKFLYGEDEWDFCFLNPRGPCKISWQLAKHDIKKVNRDTGEKKAIL